MTKKGLKGFQNRFISAVLRPGIRRAVLSLPRGNGKSWLAGFLASEALRPGGALFRAGDENVLLSGSFNQARYTFRFAKGLLGESGYTYQDNKQQMGIHHLASGTRLLVKSSLAALTCICGSSIGRSRSSDRFVSRGRSSTGSSAWTRPRRTIGAPLITSAQTVCASYRK